MERFYRYFIPQSYQLQLTLDRSASSLKGDVVIVGQVQADEIKFHAVGLEITAVRYAVIPSQSQPTARSRSAKATASRQTMQPDRDCAFSYDGETLTIPRSALNDVKVGATVAFLLQYSTTLNTNMQGCYLSSYEHQGQTRSLAVTQFESHYARETFPCIDEPAAKATFDLTLTIPDLADDDVVLSNMPLSKHQGQSFHFAATPRMSTYLLAWVVGPLQSLSTTNQHGVTVTSYAALNQPQATLEFANTTAARALDYYDERYGIKYPLPKLDQVAIPDFEAGAMENWGLVTYRESMMLADPHAALDVRKSVATTVTHELSHQWFGNLVTMKWWDDLWLNESFATIMEYYATDALYPDFQIWEDFYTSECLAALRRDAYDGVQAVKQPVADPAEIATLFDAAIVYAKGARLVLMLIHLMGESAFYAGLKQYFQEFAYENTDDQDLWRALDAHADFAVGEFMSAWLSQPGYPKISSQGELQGRFFLDQHLDSGETKWPLPHYSDDMSGHYLIQLTDAEFQEKLQHVSELSVDQQLRLLIDHMLLARTQFVDSSSLLDLIAHFADTSSATVLEIVALIINDLKLFCPPETPAAATYQAFLRQHFGARWQELDFTASDLDSNAIKARDSLLSIAHYAADQPTLERLAQLYQPDLTKIDPELRLHVLGAKLYFSEQGIFPHLLDVYQSTSDPELKSTILCILASDSKLESSQDRLLKLLNEPAVVRPQDHIFLYIYLLRNYRTRTRTLDWLIQNWDYVKRLTGDKSLEDYPRYAASVLRTPADAEKFYQFFDRLAQDPILGRTIKIAHGEIDARLELIRLDAPGVQQKLRALVSPQPSA